MASFAQDVRYAVRMLARNPGFTIVAILTLALGIGANTAIFSVVRRVLLQPPPYQQPQSLVQIWNTYFPAWPQLGLSPGDFQDFRRQAKSFSEMAAYIDIPAGFNLTGQGEPERVQAAYADSNLFPMLGVRPVAGRTFTPDQDKPGNTPVVLLTHRFWQSHFGSDPSVVGRSLTFDGKSYVVIGVLPPRLDLARYADLWLPVGLYEDDLTGHIHHPFNGIARLKPGVSLSEAQAELITLNHQEELAFPDTHKNWGVTIQQMQDPSAAKLRPALLVLFAAVGLVLLIACANIVNLLLARNAARQKEIALRIALGASRSRLVAQLLTESVLLSILGGIGGILLASIGLRALDALVPSDLAVVRETGLNGWVLAFTIAVCFVSGMVCGLIPAIQSLNQDLHTVLKEGGRTSSATGGNRLRSILVVSQVALALIPLVGAGLLLRSFHRLLSVDPGFRSDHILTMEVEQPGIPLADVLKMSNDQQVQLFRKQSIQFQQMADRIRNLPGVKAVGGIDFLPLATALHSASRFLVEGQPTLEAGARPVAQTRTTSLGYFAAMGIPLLKGRRFTDADLGGSNIVVNDATAKRFWPGADPIGKRINLCSLAPQPCWSEIVGVVGDIHQFGLDAAPTFDVYGAGGWTPHFVIRTSSDPTALAHAATEEIRKIDPNLPVIHVTTIDGLLSDTVAPRRFSTVLLGIFAVLALLLAAVGIYGVMSYVVSLRINEIGIRMALGAQPRDIWQLIIGRGAKLAVAGVAIGLAGSLALSRLLASLLFEVRASDPLTFGGVALLLTAVALVACYFPARWAMRADPMIALRYE
ncbi:MAG: ABC transporter permease [Candidatus Acidiferrales bacterium]